MNDYNRRKFLQLSGLSSLAFMPSSTLLSSPRKSMNPLPEENKPVSFAADGPMYDATEYISKLDQINKITPIKRDFYGNGGTLDVLLKKFIPITGKEDAIYMPSGTMANQLAIHVLCGENTKVFVQETSHVYRDEADAAQSLFSKRLIPLAKGETAFSFEQLQDAIKYHDDGEVFKSGIGVVSIENPVRRTDGGTFPIEEIKKISSYCRKNGYKLHLDGARIFMASMFSGISVKEYSSYFDTIYISLYKYLGAAGGAVLCGDNDVINKMPHLIKIHGGTMFSSWSNAAMALYHLDGLEDRLQRSKEKAVELFEVLNSTTDLKISPLKNGSNIFILYLQPKIDAGKFSKYLNEKHRILLGRGSGEKFQVLVNETILNRDNKKIIEAFIEALKVAQLIRQ